MTVSPTAQPGRPRVTRSPGRRPMRIPGAVKLLKPFPSPVF